MRNFAVQEKCFSVIIKDVVSALERFAPLPLQEDYDNAGLQIGLTEAEVSGALLCLDVNEAIVEEAVEKGCNLIISHHPLIFRKLRRITDEDYVQRTVYRAIQQGIAIVAMHTNLDKAMGGVNYKIAEKMQLQEVRLIGHKQEAYPSIRDGLHEPLAVLGGEGVMGTLPEPMEAKCFINMLKEKFGVACVQANALLLRPVRTVAICGGAGAMLLDEAIAQGADAFVTGEMRYHEFFGHEQQLQIAVIGHYESEQYTNEIFKSILEELFPGIRCEKTNVNTNPIIYL